jgi:hypothetical protein
LITGQLLAGNSVLPSYWSESKHFSAIDKQLSNAIAQPITSISALPTNDQQQSIAQLLASNSALHDMYRQFNIVQLLVDNFTLPRC